MNLLTAIGLTPGGSSTVHIYTQTIHRTTKKIHRRTQTFLEQCGPCSVLASYTLAYALQLRKKRGKTSVRVAEISHKSAHIMGLDCFWNNRFTPLPIVVSEQHL